MTLEPDFNDFILLLNKHEEALSPTQGFPPELS
jgi:hypothetical protein